MTYDVDLFIIGAGPAGLAAAKQAAHYGVRVAIAEQHQLGGCCVNRGCIPKKLMVYAADYAAAMHNAVDYGWDSCASDFHWQRFREKRDRELERLRQVQQNALQEAGVKVLNGHVCFQDTHTLAVDGTAYTADKILIAVGGKPILPKIPGIEYALTSNGLFDIEQLPQRIAIIGGGYIGVEFASILRGFGCEATLMDRGDRLLDGFDEGIQQRIQEGLSQRGIQSFCSTTTDQIVSTPEGLCLHLTGDCPEKLVVDQVLCAIGRAPQLEGLGLEAAGVEFDKKAIAVNDQSQTNQPHIYAVGDCTNRKPLTPVARVEGQAAVDAMYGKGGSNPDYTLIPSAVCSRPEAASVGLTEAAAREQYGDAVQCHSKTFVPLKYSLIDPPQEAWIKLVVDEKRDRLLGLHMVGQDAAEVVQSGAIALQQAVTASAFLDTIGIHPSTTEELFSLRLSMEG